MNIHNDDGTFLKTQCLKATEYSGQTPMMVAIRRSRAYKNYLKIINVTYV